MHWVSPELFNSPLEWGKFEAEVVFRFSLKIDLATKTIAHAETRVDVAWLFKCPFVESPGQGGKYGLHGSAADN